MVGLLADLHSNPFALQAVMDDMVSQRVERVVVAGDCFGYYPWAQETYQLLAALPTLAVLGNHDQLVLRSRLAPLGPGARERGLPYFEASRLNGQQLSSAGLAWLSSLAAKLDISAAGWELRVVHGTPDRPLEGRYYPDDASHPGWMPVRRELLVLGHTHYPLCRALPSGGLVVNPGSVGQPRDGDPRAAWALLDTEGLGSAGACVELRRVRYDQLAVMSRLREMGWPEGFVRALDKRGSKPPECHCCERSRPPYSERQPS